MADRQPPASCVIRSAQADDRDFILGLVPQLHAFGPPAWHDRLHMEAVDRRVIGDALVGRTPNSAVFVAECENGERVGFVHVAEEEDYYTGRCAHIGDVVVAPMWQGRGIGKALLAWAEQWARDRACRLITLNVFMENQQARSAYERSGYRPETVRYTKDVGPA